ncbi:glycosyltransferase [Sphingobacterium faecium]|uniref:glycosyltransferase n=1 Tax=Sphingobacterium faecium TaxID=34087 RepID=UPI00320B055F
MTEQPLISIIMPVYNTEQYVDAAIESVIKQEFKDFELLLINDGSPDHSAQILQKWADHDQRVQVFYQHNQGLSAARNKGLSLAKGKYVYFMDSDDMVRPDTLASCIAYCDEWHLDFVYFDAAVFGEEKDAELLSGFYYSRNKVFPYAVCTGPQALASQLDHGEFFSSACMLFIKKELLDQHALKFEVGLLHEDELFTILLYLQSKRVAYLSQQFFLRRVRADSIMTSSLKLYNIQCYFKIADLLLSFADQQGENMDIVKQYLKSMLNAAVWKAHVLPFRDRCTVLFFILKGWLGYIRARSLFVLLFKKFYSYK